MQTQTTQPSATPAPATTSAAPSTPATSTSSAPADAKPAAPPADGKAAPAAAPATPPADKPVSAMSLAEFNRKEFAFRNEKQKFEGERKTWEAQQAERAQAEEKWKADPIALLEQFGHKIDSVIDFAAKGGSDSPEGRVRAMEAKLAQREREDKERAEKQKQDSEQRERLAAAQRAMTYVSTEVEKLTKDPKYELCAATPGVADEVAKLIAKKWTEEQVDLSIEAALELCESELDRRLSSYAQSSKLKAKLSPSAAKPGEEAKPDASRQDSTVPTATKRTITIKNRQQAVAPIRKASDARKPSADAVREAGERLAVLFGKK